MKETRTTTVYDLLAIEEGMGLREMGRETFKLARAKKTTDYTRRAIKSAQGALRHADRCREVKTDDAKTL